MNAGHHPCHRRNSFSDDAAGKGADYRTASTSVEGRRKNSRSSLGARLKERNAGNPCHHRSFSDAAGRGLEAADRTGSSKNEEKRKTRRRPAGGELPVVYHEDYSIDWPRSHRFPMWKFRDLAEFLQSSEVEVVNNVDEPGASSKFMSPFLRPEDPPDEWFLLAHDEEYLHVKCSGV